LGLLFLLLLNFFLNLATILSVITNFLFSLIVTVHTETEYQL